MANFSIIFDLDGTLWNATKTVDVAWQRVIKEECKDMHFTVEDFKRIAGLTTDEIADTLFSNYDEKRRKEILNKCLEEENVEIRKQGGVLFPKVIEILQELSKEYDLYIVSNCQKGYIESFLDYYNLSSLFKDTECYGNNEKEKKENIKLIKERNKIEKCCYIGDTNGDARSARESNTPFIYASYGFGNVTDYDEILYKFEDIVECIKKIR